MTACHIDHLVITAPDLSTGSQFIAQQLGVSMQPGGEHPLMGTHNLLLSLGPSCYLEVIAPSPTLPTPARPRWFGLDNQTPGGPAALTTWVARTTAISTISAWAGEELGPIEAMFRDLLHWQITIPGDGSLPLGGTAPALIQWPADQHPATRLTDQGLRLEQLELRHPQPERLQQLLTAINLFGPVTITTGQTPQVIAHIRTEHGVCLVSADNRN